MRPRTLPRRLRVVGGIDYPKATRPHSRGDCDAERPCPWCGEVVRMRVEPSRRMRSEVASGEPTRARICCPKCDRTVRFKTDGTLWWWGKQTAKSGKAGAPSMVVTNHARPCPWVSCKHHLALDVNRKSGSVKMNFPDVDLADLAETCVLDVADRQGATLEDVGALMNVTRERIRQIEAKGMRLLRKTAAPLWDGDLPEDVAAGGVEDDALAE